MDHLCRGIVDFNNWWPCLGADVERSQILKEMKNHATLLVQGVSGEYNSGADGGSAEGKFARRLQVHAVSRR